jgi:UDP-3-O-[3-hydroxymyristoyl] glucosamine N-acyltransferase
MKRTILEIEKLLPPGHYRIVGDNNREFNNIRSIDQADRGDLTFCNRKGDEAVKLVMNTKASIVICYDLPYSAENKTLIIVDNPRQVIIKCINKFSPVKRPVGIHDSAVIGTNCSIGSNVYLGPNVSVGDGVTIEEGSVIYPGVYIYDGVKIGRNVTIKSNSVIGSSGAGYERVENGVLERFPQIGNVIIEDNVDIGANCCVDRGALSDTLIKEGTKLDNLIHVAHNDTIGKNCFVAAGAVFSGSVSIGDGCFIGVSASFKERVRVGNDVVVGMGAVVIRDIPDGDVVAGVPAKSLKKPT